jgi:hypothetical protein
MALSLYQRGFNGQLSFGAITVGLYIVSNQYSLLRWRLRGLRTTAKTQSPSWPSARRQSAAR